MGEAAQADYEVLRAHLLSAGELPASLAAARFARRDLAGLIAWPAAGPVFDAELAGARRPRWSPHADPRLDALAAGFAFLLGAGGEQSPARAWQDGRDEGGAPSQLRRQVVEAGAGTRRPGRSRSAA